jgi:hypothetical protein
MCEIWPANRRSLLRSSDREASAGTLEHFLGCELLQKLIAFVLEQGADHAIARSFTRDRQFALELRVEQFVKIIRHLVGGDHPRVVAETQVGLTISHPEDAIALKFDSCLFRIFGEARRPVGL